jgi:hypothetical protein
MIMYVGTEVLMDVTMKDMIWILMLCRFMDDRPCGLVVRVLGYRSGGPGSIPGTTKKM